MGRSPCCDKLGLKKGPWTPEEDQKLLDYINQHGHGNWRALPSEAGLERCGKSCRLRWTNYLRPDIKRGKFSSQEEQTIIQLHALLGNRWSAIATHLPKRTDNEIKNYWNTHLKKKLTKMGIDPVTHKPKNEGLLSTGDGGQQTKNVATLSHMAQWESARLEAEARLVRQSKLRSATSSSLITTHIPSPMMNNFDTTNKITNNNGIMPQCLDVLKVWNTNNNTWQPSSSNSATTTATPGVGLGLIEGGGSGGIGRDSPTSTHSFSENGPLRVPTTGPAMIEFMEHGNGTENENMSNNRQMEQELVKEAESRINYYNDSHDRSNYNNNHSDYRVNITALEHSMSYSASSAINDVIESNDNDDDEANDDHHQSFMQGFTELLLGGGGTVNNNNEKSQTDGDGGPHKISNNNNNKSNNEDNNSSCSDYYEDNKNYWNTILNLVNSSPSHSPMF